MDLDLALQSDQLTATPENPNEVKIEKWDRSNRMCLMIMKRSIPEAFRGSITESKSAKKFLEEIQQYFTKNKKSEASNLLAKLVAMKYKGKGNIREYIMEMSHLASKLKSLKLELSEDLLVHLVLISLPAHFGQFKVSYNTQKDKWSLNELISHCVQEEERQQRDKTESTHLASTSQNEKRKRAKAVKKRRDYLLKDRYLRVLDMTPRPKLKLHRQCKRPKLSVTEDVINLDDGQQKISHITVERNRRKQMNEHLSVLRS
ncbi:hypothetical protein HHK36_032815 [Tetracentron sinense]|uniref:BHLH domain-containing protein n=1 Tax=Tetracentron sinense TaxID=13715 RepID=A0A835CZ76_TETSI|nr:hypothetical protein HHK36_032815 [Tetracentron sinense]